VQRIQFDAKLKVGYRYKSIGSTILLSSLVLTLGQLETIENTKNGIINPCIWSKSGARLSQGQVPSAQLEEKQNATCYNINVTAQKIPLNVIW
jgi:hypothetical protein